MRVASHQFIEGDRGNIHFRLSEHIVDDVFFQYKGFDFTKAAAIAVVVLEHFFRIFVALGEIFDLRLDLFLGRVRLGLILSQLVGDNKLHATQEQVKAQIEDFAQSYEDPKEVLKYYYSDRRRLSEVEALVLEENVVNYVLGKAKVTTKAVAFDELMGSNAQA